MVGDGQRDHLARGACSPTQPVELLTDFHTVHTHAFHFSIFARLTSGFQPLGVKNENEHENQSSCVSALLC